MESLNVYKGKNILVTGHTGFKGAWLSIWLHKLGANVIGFSLKEYYNDYIYQNAKLNKILFSDEKGDINDYNRLKEVFQKYQPEGVFHLAAQPLVRLSYDLPKETFQTNILGTVNVLECIKKTPSVKMGVMVTTDKCYKNRETPKGYKEQDELGGIDPYGSSKACAEIVINSYRESFFKSSKKLVASARAGNVIGGGDLATDRLIPDCIAALSKNEPIKLRNPFALRPWQHVLEPLYGYLLLGKGLFEQNERFADAWNFGPDQNSTTTVKKVAEILIEAWGSGRWVEGNKQSEDKKEAKTLILDNAKSKKILGWHPKWDINHAVKETADWYKRSKSEDIYKLCLEQINDFIGGQ